MDFTIVTGMSGSGKSKAVQTFEDLGYFCIDNMPPALIPMLADMLSAFKDDYGKVALVIDVRVGDMIKELLSQISALETSHRTRLIFLDSSDSVLVKRYKETRRAHPLNNPDGLVASIKEERKMLAKLKDEANFVIDTTDMTPSGLRERIMDIYDLKKPQSVFEIKVVSFGFKHGIPLDADMVYDVRCFPNPYYIPELKNKTGNDKDVYDYVLSTDEAKQFFAKIKDMAEFLIPVFAKEGRYSLIIAIGCTGGHHRSVTFTNALCEALKADGYKVSAVHRDINL